MQNHGGFSSIRYVSLFLKAAQTYDKHYYMILADEDWYMPIESYKYSIIFFVSIKSFFSTHSYYMTLV